MSERINLLPTVVSTGIIAGMATTDVVLSHVTKMNEADAFLVSYIGPMVVLAITALISESVRNNREKRAWEKSLNKYTYPANFADPPQRLEAFGEIT